LFSGSLGHADTLLSSFEKEHLVRPDVVIVTGEVNHGKTTVAQGVISYLLERNIKIAGFLCPGNDENGERKEKLFTVQKDSKGLQEIPIGSELEGKKINKIISVFFSLRSF